MKCRQTTADSKRLGAVLLSTGRGPCTQRLFDNVQHGSLSSIKKCVLVSRVIEDLRHSTTVAVTWHNVALIHTHTHTGTDKVTENTTHYVCMFNNRTTFMWMNTCWNSCNDISPTTIKTNANKRKLKYWKQLPYIPVSFWVMIFSSFLIQIKYTENSIPLLLFIYNE